MRPRQVARQFWRGAALVSIGLAGGAALVTARHLLATPQPLESGLAGEGRVDKRHGGDIYYTVAGPVDGRPVVLLHGLYPGASSYEFHAVFARLAETYRVYAPDWLGFGMSERPALTYTGEFYSSMLIGFLRDVVGAPSAVVAYGLAGNIATRAAADAPELFDRLALVAPEPDAGMLLEPTLSQTVTRLLQKVALGMVPYALMSLRPTLRLSAGRRSAVGVQEVDDGTLDHLYASAHQFGGEHATLSLFTGEFDLPIRQIFPTLRMPTLIMIGARDSRHSLADMERLVALNARADLEMISNAGESVFLDQPTLFLHTLHRWLARRVARHEPAATPLAAPAAAPVATAIGAAVAPQQVEPAMPVVKTVPVLEPPVSPQIEQAPGELRIPHAPDAAASKNSSASDPMNIAQPLTRERTSGTSAPDASGPLGQLARPDVAGGQRSSGARSTQASELQGGAYLYAPELHVHVLRSDGGSGPGALRSPRRRTER